MTNKESRVREQLENVSEKSKELIGEHAFPTALFAYALGIGVGLVAVNVMADTSRRRHGTVTRRLGQQILDAMTSVVPDSLTKR